MRCVPISADTLRVPAWTLTPPQKARCAEMTCYILAGATFRLQVVITWIQLPHMWPRGWAQIGVRRRQLAEKQNTGISASECTAETYFFFSSFFFVVSSFCENLDDKEKDVFGFLKRDVPDVTHKQCTDTYREHPLILLQPPLHFQSPCWWKTSTIHLSCPSTPQASYSCGNKRNLSLITLKINDDMAKVEVDICRSVGTRLKRWLFANH